MTPAQKRAATEQKQQEAAALSKYPNNDIHTLDLSPGQVEQSRFEHAEAKAERAGRTATEKKALQLKKQKELEFVEKSGPGE